MIAAINGAAVGIGATMTLGMDIRMASTEARIGFVFGRIGITPEAASSWFLPRIVGLQQALEWIYAADFLTAEAALAGRLVRSVHPPAELLLAVRRLRDEIARPQRDEPEHDEHAQADERDEAPSTHPGLRRVRNRDRWKR